MHLFTTCNVEIILSLSDVVFDEKSEWAYWVASFAVSKAQLGDDKYIANISSVLFERLQEDLLGEIEAPTIRNICFAKTFPPNAFFGVECIYALECIVKKNEVRVINGRLREKSGFKTEEKMAFRK